MTHCDRVCECLEPLSFIILPGIVTENQFSCGLALACSGRDAPRISREEMASVIALFRAPNGRGVLYRKFADTVDFCSCLLSNCYHFQLL